MIPIGIDLGTTNCCMAAFRNGKTDVIPVEGQNTMPSILAQKPNGEIVIGKFAKIANSPLYRYAFVKRKMGIDFEYPLKDGKHSPTSITALYLEKLKKVAEEHLNSEVAAVITVPAHFLEIHLQETRQAAKIAELKIIDIIREPVAAAISYYSDIADAMSAEKGKILVYDFGGGTFDATVCSIQGRHIEVGGRGKAYDGDKFLGGYDIDRAIIQLIVPTLKKQDFLSSENSLREGDEGAFTYELLKEAERVKIALSKDTDAEWDQVLEIVSSQRVAKISEYISRSQFENAIEEILDKTLAICENALLQSGILIPGNEDHDKDRIIKSEAQSINAVILVGGSTRIPAVKTKIRKFFEDRYEVSLPVRLYKPDECVAIGAALYASQKGTEHRTAKTVDGKISVSWISPPPENVPYEMNRHPSLNGKIEGCEQSDLTVHYHVCSEKQFLSGEDEKDSDTDHYENSVNTAPDFSFIIPEFPLPHEVNRLLFYISDNNGNKVFSWSEMIRRGGTTANPGGLARHIYIRLADGRCELLSAGIHPRTVIKNTFFINDDSSKVRAPLFEGYHEIGTIEFKSNAPAGTPVLFETYYETGSIHVDISIEGSSIQKRNIELKPIRTEKDRDRLEKVFLELEKSTAELLDQWPVDSKDAVCFRKKRVILIMDIRLELEGRVVPDYDRIGDRLRRLELLKWEISKLSMTKQGLIIRLNFLLSRLDSINTDDSALMMEKLAQIEAQIADKDDVPTIENAFNKLEEIEKSIYRRIRTRAITAEDVASIESNIRGKIQKIEQLSNIGKENRQKLLSIKASLKEILKIKKSYADQWTRLNFIDSSNLNPLFIDTVIKEEQRGLLRLRK